MINLILQHDFFKIPKIICKLLHHVNFITEEVAKDRASYLLDLAVAAPTEYTWAGLRADLAELLRTQMNNNE